MTHLDRENMYIQFRVEGVVLFPLKLIFTDGPEEKKRETEKRKPPNRVGHENHWTNTLRRNSITAITMKEKIKTQTFRWLLTFEAGLDRPPGIHSPPGFR